MRLRIDERILAGLTHVLPMVGVLHMIALMLSLPLFPPQTLWFLVPNALLALLWWPVSCYVWHHALQALAIHVMGLGMALVPWFIRDLGAHGMLSERWAYTGWGGYGFNAAFALMALTFIVGGIAVLSLTADAIVRALRGEQIQYPGLGRLAVRLTRW